MSFWQFRKEAAKSTHASLSNLIAKLKLGNLKKLSLPWYVVFYLVVLYYSTVLNAQIISHFYRILENSQNVSTLFSLTPPLVLFSALSIVFLVFCFRYVFKTVMALLVFIGSITGYFAYKYGIIFDYDMMINLLQTNPQEAKSYLSFEIFYKIFIFGVLPTLFILFVKIKWSKTFLRAIVGRVIILAIASSTLYVITANYYQNYASIGRNHNILRKEISPYNFVWFGYKAIKQTYFPENVVFQKHGTDSIIDNPGERPEIFVVVVGETARAQNFKHNGYARNTTPYTESLENFTKFAPVTSCGTATAISVPCMFSIMNRDHYDEKKAKHQSSLVDVLKYAGYKVMWFDNDGGCKGVCDRVEHEDLVVNDPELKGVCTDDSCYDEALLRKLKLRVDAAAKSKKSTVIFLHVIGSHGPTYFKRLPDNLKQFKPSCERADIENCSVEEIVNAYDNTLVYTDYILKGVVDILRPYSKNFGTAMFYISDHGESLGEDGLFLHGAPYAIAPIFQRRVPMMTWFSNAFAEDHKMNLGCLNQEAQKEQFSQDNFFHSLLGILDVNTSFYDEDLDLFNRCRIWKKQNRN